MNGEVNPHQRMVYNWPLITNTRAGEIDALLDSKTYKKTYITTCVIKSKNATRRTKAKILTWDRCKNAPGLN